MLMQTVAVVVLVGVVAVGLLAVVVPRLVGGVPLTILTGSMEPGLPPGTLVVVRPVDPADIRVGDVVTYQIRPGVPGVISHRVVGITVGAAGRTFTLKGDANSEPDRAAVVEGQVMGEVWYSVPWLGWLNTGVSAGARAWLVPAVGVALLAYAAFVTGRGVVRRRRTERQSAPWPGRARASPPPATAADVAGVSPSSGSAGGGRSRRPGSASRSGVASRGTS